MPKVDDEHLNRRRDEILAAARRCFVRKGFAGTSIPDIVAEAGLSTGAIYRYFAGKEELVSAVAASASDDVLAVLVQGDVDAIADTIKAQAETKGQAGLMAQVWGAAATTPPLADAVRVTHARLRIAIAEAIEHQRKVGRLAAGAPADEVADGVLALCTGLFVLLAVDPDLDVTPQRSALRALLRPAG